MNDVASDMRAKKKAEIVSAVVAKMRADGHKVRSAKATYTTCSIAFEKGQKVPLDVIVLPSTWRGEPVTKVIVKVGDYDDRASRKTFRAMRKEIDVQAIADHVVHAHAGRVALASRQAMERDAIAKAKAINAELGIDEDQAEAICATSDKNGGITIRFEKTGTSEQIASVLTEAIVCGLIQPNFKKKRSVRR